MGRKLTLKNLQEGVKTIDEKLKIETNTKKIRTLKTRRRIYLKKLSTTQKNVNSKSKEMEQKKDNSNNSSNSNNIHALPLLASSSSNNNNNNNAADGMACMEMGNTSCLVQVFGPREVILFLFLFSIILLYSYSLLFFSILILIIIMNDI